MSYFELLKRCEPEQVEALQETKDSLGFSFETQFQPLDGGLTRAKLYSFEMEGKKYVLRFLSLGPNQPKEARQNEIRALKIGVDLKIAPPCIFSDENAFLVVMPFIKGQLLRNPNTLQLSRLGKMLHSLHSFQGDYPTRYTFLERLERHYQKGLKMGTAYPTGFDHEVQWVLSHPSSRSPVPSHGDLNPSNILVGEEGISLIDWTNATWDDPFADLSYFCLLSHLSSAQERVFLEAYFGRGATEEEVRALQEEKAKAYLLTAAIWFRFSETAEDLLLPVEGRATVLDRELASPSLKRARDYLREGVVVNLNTAPKSEIRSYALSFYKAYLEAINRER